MGFATDPLYVCSSHTKCITCDGAGNVQKINLKGLNNYQQMTRTLPDHTQHPFTTYNYESMGITEIQCDLCTNTLGTLPAVWGRMKSLTRLNFRKSPITGTLPREWGQLTGLSVLSLGTCKLTGTLPPEWSRMTSLRELSLDNNGLTGTLPTGWQSLKNLDFIDLNSNKLSGTLPPEWSKMSGLRVLNVKHNDLEGYIPLSYTEYSFPGIEEILVTENPKLWGCMPPSWKMVASKLYTSYTAIFTQSGGYRCAYTDCSALRQGGDGCAVCDKGFTLNEATNACDSSRRNNGSSVRSVGSMAAALLGAVLLALLL
ncbi:surface antigen protein 2 [Angomonas deanei]|nr:surface antigen protein 2 [Angomonas deanei]|eukprot:EPY20767.1 surface antigen protein 2 [Angomonas deanei]